MLSKLKKSFKELSSFEGAKTAIRTKNSIKKISIDPESFETINPIHSIEDGFILSKDGMVYRGFRISEPHYEKSDTRAFSEMAEALDSAYRELPIGSCVHRQIPFYNVYYNESSQNYDMDYSKFFDFNKKQNMVTQPILSHNSFLFIGISANKENGKVKTSPLNNIFATKGGIFSNPFQNLEGVIETIDDVASRFFQRLTIIGVKNTRLENEELKQVVKQYLNLDFIKKNHTDITVNYSNKFPYFQAGNKLVGVASFSGELNEVKSSVKNKYGIESSFNHSLYYNLPFPHIVNQYVYVRDQVQVLQEIEERRILIESTQDRVIADDMVAHVNEVRSNNQKLLEFGTNIICYSHKENELNHFLEQSTNAIMAMGKCQAQIEVIEDTASIFFSSLPGAIHNNYRRYLYPSIYCGCLTTFPGRYYDAGNFIVRGRDGAPVMIRTNPEDIKQSNNSVIVGPTGGGKSVFANVMMAHYLEQGDEVMIVDKGGSYKMLAKLFGLKYYDFVDMEKVDLNFFETQKDDFGKYLINQDKKDGIISVLRLLWRMDKQGALTTTEETILEVILELFYEQINKSGDDLVMDSFLQFNKTLKKEEIIDRIDIGQFDIDRYFNREEFLLALSRYSGKQSGYNGKIFNQKSNTYFTKGISAIYDIANIAQVPGLYSIFTVSLSNVILQGMYNRRHVRKHLVYDESSEALPGDQGKLLRMLFREVRKENGDVNIIVQLITDITGNANGKVILDNAINRYLLDHKLATGSLPDVRSALQLTDHGFDLLKSLNKIPSPKYREFFRQRMDETSVYALELPESLRLAVSTSADDQKVLTEILKKIKDPQLALKQYIENLQIKAA